MRIRSERPADVHAIEQVHIAAFATCAYSRQTEHLIVNALRAAGALSVSLVAEEDGEMVGHIAFSPIRIDGRECPWYILGPIGVLPRLQRLGIGKALMGDGIGALRKLGAAGCVLVGDPEYYRRFGFRNHPALGLDGVPPENFLYLPLTAEPPHGMVEHHAAFLVTD